MTDRFSHEALLYDGPAQFLDGTLPFLRDGLARDEGMLVALPADRIARLERELGEDAERVSFADMAELGRNPARIIPAWRDFLDEQAAAGRPFRGIGEPIWAGRTPGELVECQHHESLLNLAFDVGPAWRLLCPYDTDALPQDVIQEAQRSHPSLWQDGVGCASPSYVTPEATLSEGDDLPPPPPEAHRLAFTGERLSDLRKLVARCAGSASLGPERTSDLVLATSEVATNSILHGGGEGTLAIWQEPGALICEVRDRGRITDPLVGRERPSPDKLRGRGIWLVNQLCDLVQIRTTPSGSVVRLRMVPGVPARELFEGDS
jgi:anti-sigma regulatory factor (Ser/Thr protein kinase)